LDFVGHGIRTKLDELKRKELDRLRQVMRLKSYLQKSKLLQGCQSWGGWGCDSQILGRGRGQVVKYYILSCTGSMFNSGDF